MLSVLLFDEHPLSLEGLKTFLKKDPSLEIKGATTSYLEFEESLREREPDIAMAGLPMKDVSPLLQLSGKYKSIKMVILYTDFNTDFFKKAIKSGVKGLVSKRKCIHELPCAFNSMLTDDTYISTEITAKDFLVTNSRKSGINVLTRKEMEILSLICKGNTTKQIADDLHISFNTTQTHRRNIMNKLEIHSVAGLMNWRSEQMYV